VLAPRSGSPRARGAEPVGAVEPRRPTPRAVAPLSPRRPLMRMRAPAERWALAILRSSLGVFLVLWGIGKLVVAAGAATISPPLSGGVATLEIVLGAFVLLGLWRRWSYATLFAVHVGSLLLWWRALGDPWGVALAGLPVCGALVALYLLRDRDGWALDTWLAWRRPWRLMR